MSKPTACRALGRDLRSGQLPRWTSGMRLWPTCWEQAPPAQRRSERERPGAAVALRLGRWTRRSLQAARRLAQHIAQGDQDQRNPPRLQPGPTHSSRSRNQPDCKPATPANLSRRSLFSPTRKHYESCSLRVAIVGLQVGLQVDLAPARSRAAGRHAPNSSSKHRNPNL